MKRRLTLARALVNDPRMLFMDEPTTGLDPQARHLIWERLRRLAQEGRTLVLTTHFMEEAERLCTRVAIMDRGRIIVAGHAARAHRPAHRAAGGRSARTGRRGLDRAGTRAACTRTELAGDTVFCYASDVEPLIASLRAQSELAYLHRPANLEDLFLKLTGRDLRD